MTKLEEIKRLLAAETPRPWEFKSDKWSDSAGASWNNDLRLAPGVPLVEGKGGTPEGDEIDQANAHLIANAPEWLAKLIAVAEAADYLHRARAALVDAHSDPEGRLSACYSGGWAGLTKALEELK